MADRPEALDDIKRATAAAVAAELDDPPSGIPWRAIALSARRP